MASAPPIYEPGRPAAQVPLSNVDPAGPGAAVARGLSDLGNVAAHAARASQATAWAAGDADRGAQMSGAYLDLQDQYGAQPGAAGFADAALRKYDELHAGVALPKDPELAGQARVQMAQDRARLHAQAESFEHERRGAAIADNAETALNTNVQTLGDAIPLGNPAAAEAAIAATIDKGRTMLSATYGISPLASDRLAGALPDTAYVAGVNRLIDQGDLAGASTLLGNGSAGRFGVTPKATEALRNRVDVEQRRNEAAARAQAALGKGQAEQQIEITLKKVADGIEVPPAELEQAHALAGQYDLQVKDYDIADAQRRQAVNVETKPWKPEDFRHEMDALAAKQARHAATPADQVRLDQLRKIAPGRIAQFNADPGAWAAANNNPRPAMTLDDAGSIAARGAWAAGVARAAGRPWVPLLAPEEAAPLIETAAHGRPQDQYQTARSVGAFGGYAPWVLRQVAPNDQRFQTAAQLGTLPDHGATMRDAFLGADALTANPNLLIIPTGGAKITVGGRPVPTTRPDVVFNDYVGDALKLLPLSYKTAVLENARNIYAARATRAGLAAWNQPAFNGGIASALGAMRDSAGGQVGGIGVWNGSKLLLPVGMRLDEFDRRLSRASGEQLVAAARGGHAPIFNTGTKLTPRQLRALVPTAIGDGVYAFGDGNGYVQASDGKRFELDIRKVRP